MLVVILCLNKQMSKNVLCILPNTLFRKSIIQKIITLHNISDCIIWEHPSYFIKYNYNKKKLVLHRASLKSYYDDIKHLFISCKYITFKEKPKIGKNATMYMFDFTNLMDDHKKIEMTATKVYYIESPNFLLTKHDLRKIKRDHTIADVPSFTPFFKSNVKKLSKFINEVKFQELPKIQEDIESIITSLKKSSPYVTTSDNAYVKEAVVYVEKLFPKNIGNTTRFDYPINHEQARSWLRYVIKNVLPFNFTYKHFMNNSSNLFEAILSSSLNIGLLNPIEIIQIIHNSEQKVCHQSFIDLIKRLYFREYKRYIYLCYSDNIINTSKLLNFSNPLSIEWYNGETGMYPVNVTINKSIKNAFCSENEAHHILGSYMLLTEVVANDAFNWFMEISIDSYEWMVMYNVYEVIFQRKSIKRLLKPSVEITKMFDFEKKYEWPKIWDQTLTQFKKKHNNMLLKNNHKKVLIA